MITLKPLTKLMTSAIITRGIISFFCVLRRNLYVNEYFFDVTNGNVSGMDV